jgi:selenocysteine-specific elongation factor
VRSIVIGTAGHIDHGKSALVRALTGTDPDRLKEERERGITIDLGFAHLQLDTVNLAFVDVPGHERFVRNMLAGAGGIDLVMLVVAADESVMPQTREHFQICRLLKVAGGLIVLTKSDLADKDMLDLATLEVRELVAGSFLEHAPIVNVSARTGEGLDALRAQLVEVAKSVPERNASGPARLPIDRVFSIKGFGTVVTGTLVSGALREEQELVVLRGRGDAIVVKVRGLQVHGQRQATAGAGRRVAVNLGGVDVDDLSRGDTLCARDAFEPTRVLDVRLELLADVPPLGSGRRVRFHQGTTELLGRVSLARDGYARLRLESPAVVTRGDRFVLRAYSPLATIGGGVVLDPHPPRGPVRTPAAIARFERLDPIRAADDSTVEAFLDDRAEAGLHMSVLMSRAGLTQRSAEDVAGRLVKSKTATQIGDLLVSTRSLAQLADRLVAEVDAHHAMHPLADGMPREEARERLFRRAAPMIFDAVVDRLVAAGTLVARERLARAGRQVSLSAEEARVQDILERVYLEAKLTPPDATAVVEAAGAPRVLVDRMLSLLVRNRRLIKIESLLFHTSALETLKDDVRRMKGAGTARVDVASFKERYGITRKYAIPLLEYLDRERVTRRVGDARVVL